MQGLVGEEHMQHLTDEILREWREVVADLRACPEYYCRHNCGALTLPGNHTPRCKKLQEKHGFPPAPAVERASQKD
jgi:hypothetical protein